MNIPVTTFPINIEVERLCLKTIFRLCETTFNGLGTCKHVPCPCLFAFLQLMICILPVCISLPFTLVDISDLSLPYNASIRASLYGLVIALIFAIFHYFLLLLRKLLKMNSKFGKMQFINILFPERTSIDIILQSVVSCLLCGIGYRALFMDVLLLLTVNNYGVAILISIFCWFSINLAQFCLTSYPRLETFTPTPPDYRLTLQINQLSRPAHVTLFLLLSQLSILVHPSLPILFYVVTCILPLLWLSGWLPPANLLLPVIAEKCITILYAGTSYANYIWSIIVCVILWSSTIIIYIYIPNDLVSILLAAIIGYVLSLNIFSWINCLIWKLILHKRWKLLLNIIYFPYNVRYLNNIWSYFRLQIANYIFMPIFAFSVLIATHVIYPYMLIDNCSNAQNTGLNISNTSVCNQFENTYYMWVFLFHGIAGTILLLVCYFLSVQQRRTVLCNVIINPCYTYNRAHIKSYTLIGISFYAIASYIIRSLCISFIGLYLQSSLTVNTPYLLFVIGMIRSLHVVWRDPLRLCLDMCIVVYIDLLFAKSALWIDLSIGVHLLIVGETLNYVAKFLSKLFLIIRYIIWYIVNTKGRDLTPNIIHEHAYIICIALILLPSTVCILLLTILFELTLLPLYSLPIFCFSYSRLNSYWPSHSEHVCSTSHDSVFYRQVTPDMCRAIANLVDRGIILHPASGQNYLIRFDDRIIILSLIEVGYHYLCMSLKGLELQTTSCHEAEATAIDRIIEISNKSNINEPCTYLNKDLLHVFQPIHSTLVNTYSDAKFSLLGVLSGRSSIENCEINFNKCLAWLISKHIITAYKNNNILANTRENCNPGTSQYHARTSTSRCSCCRLKTRVHPLLANEENDTGHPFPKPEILDKMQLNTSYVEHLFPSSWLNLPNVRYTRSLKVDQIESMFNYYLDFNHLTASPGQLTEICGNIREMCTSISHLLHISTGYAINNERSTDLIFDKYNGDFSSSANLQLLFNDYIELHQLTVIAYRYAVKMTIDEAVMSNLESDQELIEWLVDVDTNWCLDTESSARWRDVATTRKKPQIFLLDYDEGERSCRSNVLTLKEQHLHIGSLSAESLRAIWTSQLFEMFYLLNTDHERYSVQQEEHYLRNISIQSGDMPVGYPIFSSAPVYI